MENPERRVGRRHSPALTLGAFAALAAILVAGLAAGSYTPPAQSQVLPDGSVVTLEGVAYGDRPVVRGSLWQRLLASAPPPLRDLSGAHVFSGGPADMLNVHVTVRDSTAATMAGATQAMAEGERGCRSPASYVSLGSTNTWSLRAFPRRSPTLTLRLFQQVSPGGVNRRWKEIAAFRTGNPVYRAYPQWSPPPLPQTVAGGNVGFRLLDLVAGVPTPNGMVGVSPVDEWWRMDYQLLLDGKPTEAWGASIKSIEDATGNMFGPNAISFSDQEGVRRMEFNGPVFPDEKAVKLTMELIRNPTASFAADELWTVRDVPVPGPGKTVSLSRSGTVQGIQIELLSLHGVGAVLPPAVQFAGKATQPLLMLRVPSSTPPGLSRSILRATDDRGGEVTIQSWASSGNEQGHFEVHRIESQPGAKRLTLTFAVHRTRTVEILAPKRAVTEIKKR